MQTVCLYCGDEDDPPGYVPMIRFRCGVCYSPYCSEACLLTDRRAHRRECRDLNLPNWFRLKRGAVAQLAPSASAYHGLAMCYHFGRGTPEDTVEAVRLYTIAAEMGHLNAQYNLGICVQRGVGTVSDPAVAFTWLQRAANAGHPMAQCAVGNALKMGHGVEIDEVAAVVYYRRSAEQGEDGGLY